MDLAWDRALGLLTEDLRRRDAAPRRCERISSTSSSSPPGPVRAACSRPMSVPRICALTSPRCLSVAAPSTSARKLAAMRALFNSQREHGLIAQNPAELVATPRRAHDLPRVLKAREAAALLDSIPAGWPSAAAGRAPTLGAALGLRDRAMFELAYACGLRAEELVSLGLDDVDHDGEQLRVEGKGRKTRFVPVGELALKAVGDYRDGAARSSRTSAGDERRRCFSGRPAVAWARAMCAGGCASGRAERPGVHGGAIGRTRCVTASRRTCWMAARTCARIQELLGHASVSSTQIYTRVESAKLKSAYASSHPRA